MRFHVHRSIRIAAVWALLLCLHAAPVVRARAADLASSEKLEREYAAEIRPLIARYCDGCHGAGETVEADLNLAA